MANQNQALHAVDAAIGNTTLPSAPMDSSPMGGLFVDADGHPLVFVLDPSVMNPHIYESHIDNNGGLVQNGAARLSNSPIVISAVPLAEDSFKPAFIDDSVRSGRQQQLEKYQHPNLKKRALEDGAEKPRKNTFKFTPEADHYILEQVRMKPRYRTSHKFFEELATHDILKAHTGNSIRSRYRAHLEHRLQYVYKTDIYDNLVLDEAGNKYAVPVSSAKTMKNKFTALEDFHLCKDILDHVLKTQPVVTVKDSAPPQFSHELLRDLKLDVTLNEDKFSVSISWFDDYARKHPSHSSSSWRDRYRKFARIYGLQQYLQDYVNASTTKEGPQPMSRLTSRSTTGKGKKSDKKRADDAVQALVNHDDLSSLASSNEVAVANMAVNSQHESLPLDEEIGETKDSNIHVGLRGVGAGQNIDDEIVINQELASRAYNEAYGELDSQEVLKEVDYMSPNITYDKIFSRPVYKDQLPGLLTRVTNFLAHLSDDPVEKVVLELVGFGLSRPFVGHVMRVTGAHAMYITQFLDQVFAALQSDDSPQVLDQILFPQNQDGFWTPETDQALMNQNYDILQHMTPSSLTNRRAFLGLE